MLVATVPMPMMIHALSSDVKEESNREHCFKNRMRRSFLRLALRSSVLQVVLASSRDVTLTGRLNDFGSLRGLLRAIMYSVDH